MDATVTLANEEMAEFLRDMPQLAGNGHTVTLDDDTATLTTDALATLADLPEDNDGHYDGTYIWIGGTEYRVTHLTGRPKIGPEVNAWIFGTRNPGLQMKRMQSQTK